ncbi:DUF1289 domain-containing protein [Polycladidibacter hongkongensis]|uniref:DUF1289 domain-containing protein n=1 Tax=Polycladidibacter hongkongensis TaxID=1647556 RepID=UPI00082A5CBB|nr:DUF1289 domain-containing protein [Pseudovibrio hongkongensis]
MKQLSHKAKAESPCTGDCEIDKARGMCRGCLRTLTEIGAWRDMSQAAQLALLQKLATRRRALAQE